MQYPEQARYLKSVRLGKKMFLRDVAAMTGIAHNRLHRLECGKVELRLLDAIKIDRALGSSILSPSFLEEHLASSKPVKGKGRGYVREKLQE